MVQILPRVKSTGEKLAGAVGDITQTLTGHFAQQHQQKQEDEALARFGIDARGLSPEMKQLAFAEKLKNQGKGEDKFVTQRQGLGTVQKMRDLIPKIGTKEALFGGLFKPESRAARQAYETYANSLIGLLSTVPIRNEKEFETAKNAIASPFSTQKEIEAALDAIEDILKRSGMEEQEIGQTFGGAGSLPGAMKNIAPGPSGTVPMFKNGQVYDIPKDKVASAKAAGFIQ